MMVPTVALDRAGLASLRDPSSRRTELQQVLAGGGVNSLIHYPIPPHRSEAYRETDWRGGAIPVAGIAGEVLSLPIGPHLTLRKSSAWLSSWHRPAVAGPRLNRR